ncbi:MAG: four helix bundle protein [Candidatus Marinimicrobia bacterium]|nr:four helix bundle protein [Candidatus Neomarinimicrobiota bacterium]
MIVEKTIHFRFQDLEIWQRSVELSISLFKIADELEVNHQFRFAEQLRGSTLSITNNIAEGSGSNSKAEFKQFLNYARRSTFETANILLILSDSKVIEINNKKLILRELDEISRMSTGFSRSL